MRRRGGLRTAPTTNECLQCFFTHPVLFTQRIDGIPTSFSVPTSCQRRRESSPSAHGAIMISAPGIFLLYPSYVQGSFLSSLPRLPFLDSRLRDRVVSIYNIRVGATAIHQMPKGELVDCQIQPPAGEEKSARCLRRSEAVVCHTILVAAYPFS